MGCGTSSNVVPQEDRANGQANENDVNGQSNENGVNGHANGKGENGQANGKGEKGHANGKVPESDDGLPTVVLPESPVKPKPPISFEIPLEQFEGARGSTPPPRLQRLLVPPQPDRSLPDIQEKLAEAEIRRQEILHQRAASAQKRTHKIIKSVNDTDRPDIEQEVVKHGSNTLKLPPEPGLCEDKNIA